MLDLAQAKDLRLIELQDYLEAGARLALSALPRTFHPPVELAMRALENVMDLTLGLGR